MPKTKYGSPALYKMMRAGSSPMWVGNTRYAANSSRFYSLVADKEHFTAQGMCL